jgi:Zn-dependent alcohol dehydrogenase
MQIKAAIVRERSGPFVIEPVELCEPRADEIIVRVVASGLCQTDLHARDGYYESAYPAVYGHEGAGVVHAVGSAVRALKPGDHVCHVVSVVRYLRQLHAADAELLRAWPPPEIGRHPRRRLDLAGA